MSADYVVPAQVITVETEVKKSRFITCISPAHSRQEAQAFVEEKRIEYPDATHHCSAFVAGAPDGGAVVGFDDDGEPSGTAGRPMLNVLQHKRIGDVVAVVVRYFGGVKLGAGGLVRAYSASVQQACEQLPLEQRVALRAGVLLCDYAHEQMVRHHLGQFHASLEQCDYGQSVKMMISMPETGKEHLARHLYDVSRGQIIIQWQDDV
ncbi:YigZ family protein [Endozoicomonas sp. GU-1]|uniref:YigZ family protein n=1 Tax=Endozoicomonas sp. GU-1 TaxID=3009078 RepID=UPI0022B456F3|nr:YigZ family protein [Endozoicomonas sp. GU-1]WBA80338.1 YigZ family protein [Endozoicomonas sp. GU-1]WBA87907.1 YigZ family protein [Endozoicomonas sp. GU-1]